MEAPGEYNGGPNCGHEGCENPVLDMPVVVFKARGHTEAENTRVPCTLLGIAFCAGCKTWAADSLAGKWAEDFAAKINPAFKASGLATVEFLRVEWKRVAKAA